MRYDEPPPEYTNSLHPLVIDSLLPAAGSSLVLVIIAFLGLAFL